MGTTWGTASCLILLVWFYSCHSHSYMSQCYAEIRFMFTSSLSDSTRVQKCQMLVSKPFRSGIICAPPQKEPRTVECGFVSASACTTDGQLDQHVKSCASDMGLSCDNTSVICNHSLCFRWLPQVSAERTEKPEPSSGDEALWSDSWARRARFGQGASRCHTL